MSYLLSFIIFFLVSAVEVEAFFSKSKVPADPNIIIFYVDDLGWADTSVPMMNSDKESFDDFNQTPALEILAKRGMKFSNAYAPAPTCTFAKKYSARQNTWPSSVHICKRCACTKTAVKMG